MSTLNIQLLYRRSKRFSNLSPFASWPCAIINPQWLELPMSRTNFHGPKDVRELKFDCITVFLYSLLIIYISRDVSKRAFWHVRPAKIQISLRKSRSLIRILTWRISECQRCNYYENTPIQIYWKVYHQKFKIFPQSMFLSRNKKNNVYPCKPQFYYIKVGFTGVKII